MIISFYETEPWEKEFFEKRLSGHTLYFCEHPLSSETIHPDTQVLSPFIYSVISQEIIDQLPNVRLIATRSTGTDHIDIKYCNEKHIIVKNVPSYGVDTIAEHTFALILALTRNILPSVERTKKGNFSLEHLRGGQLAGKTIGLIGFGAIAIRVAELAKAFKMNILVSTRTRKSEYEQTLGVRYVDLETLLKASDIVSLHVPATPETHHMLKTENIRMMKKGSLLINTARGAVVETEAIVRALEEHIIAGAGLDVLEEEKALKEERQLLTKEYHLAADVKTQLFNHILLHRENVIVTPHNAFNSQEALQEILEVTAKHILEFAKSNID